MSEELRNQIETYRRKVQQLSDIILNLNSNIEQLHLTIAALQGEPRPVVDKIFGVTIDGKFAADIVNQISRTGKATIKLYGDQIVEIL